MRAPRIPANEAQRLARLRSYDILDSETERCFDEIVRLASLICEVPIAQISLVDENRRWFKAGVGLGSVKETPRDISSCGHVVHESRMLVVGDATQDERFADNPLVAGNPNIRFYAGAPLTDSQGFTLGTLCVIDSQPRQLTPHQHEMLELLSRQVMTLIELRTRNQAATEAVRRLRQITETMDDVFWITNRDNTEVLYVSPAYASLFGRTTKSLYENPASFATGVHPDDLPRLAHALKQLVAGGSYDITYRILRPDGSLRHIRARVHNILDDAGQRYRCCGVASDITDQLNAERQIEEQRAALLSSAKMTALGEMSAGIAHEINNPVAVIHAKASQLRERALIRMPSPEELSETAEKIERTAERISRIVKSLRAFVHEGRSELMEVHPVRQIVQDTLEFCWERFRNQRIELVTEVPDEELHLMCNPIQISQVLLNLLNNSHDSVRAQDADRWVKVAVRCVRGTIDIVEIHVSDSGTPIAPEVADRLFTPFFTTKPAGAGTGLGLSVSRSLAQKHGGDLAFQRAEGRNCFVIRLPGHPSRAAAA